MSFKDPDTGLQVCKKHNWEQIEDCIYCENDHLRARNAELEAEVARLRKATEKLRRKSIRALRWIPQHDGLYGDLNAAIAALEAIAATKGDTHAKSNDDI